MDAARAASAPEFCSTSAICCKVPHPPEAMTGTDLTYRYPEIRIERDNFGSKLWMKGEESGNTQKIKEILVDCDSDALVYLVKPSGPACHTGEGTCFHNTLH